MKYKILIKKCEDPPRAQAIAAEVARWSGSTPDVVYGAITQKAICIRKEADQDEAQRLSAQFGSIGAEVELVPLAEAAPVAAMATVGVAAAVGAAPVRGPDYDEDDDEEPGRVLTDAEFAELAKHRNDVFMVEKSSRMRNTQVIAALLAIAACWFMSVQNPITGVAADFFEQVNEERNNRVAELVKEEPKEEEKKTPQEQEKSDVKRLRPTESKGVSNSAGGGDPRQRVTQMGVLGIVSGQMKGKAVASADVFGKGGFASDIDAIISGTGGLAQGGDGGTGRAGMAGIGYGSGTGSGFGGGSGGVGNLIGSLAGPSGNMNLSKKGGALKVSRPEFQVGGALSGGRSRISIQRVVMQNMPALRHAYNRRLRDKPDLTGQITVKFAINEFGAVTFAQMIGSTMNDPELERTVVERVKSWQFERIDKPGDITEVTYPFVFSQ